MNTNKCHSLQTLFIYFWKTELRQVDVLHALTHEHGYDV